MKTEEVSTESDSTIPGIPSINEDIFEDEKSVKKVIDENPEESFKIDYGEFKLRFLSTRCPQWTVHREFVN